MATEGLVLLSFGAVLGVLVRFFGPEHTGERALAETLAAHRPHWVGQTGAVLDFTLGPPGGLVSVLIVSTAALGLGSHRICLTGVAVFFTGWLAVTVAKVIFERPSPTSADLHALAPLNGVDRFPSGHVAIATSLTAAAYTVMSMSGRRRWPALAIGVPVVMIVAASRMIVGADYLANVVAAPFFAVGAVLLMLAAVRSKSYETSLERDRQQRMALLGA
ncbi:phosphatase PAP2 family protein [Luteipulveratus mongoliensis]|uniref:Phosphatidic acid phosphatase type 2/haloperoxidase domain-containing protein n=1 Tax=Luteipulveratus mongoliensis TaxID=571913 RepID=A0A0K1JKM4_9MICO|nr:phosphatase PAP2 family protein [Luteipulveratus mongoliensis]AKU17269.1 hypothetical protein VV02_17775 [Luteipulveratus mongoliensis]